MKNIMFSGPDGTGKSTIIEATKKELLDKSIKVEVVWLRFHHYFAKVINVIGRIIGKSYREKYSWGEVGYHNYQGFFGIIYVFAIYFDHILFKLFLKDKRLKKNKIYLVDRYILDIVADLIVDTKNTKLIFFLFDKYIKKELSNFDTYILECDIDIVINRRDDIKDDKKYQDKIKAYALIAYKYNIKRLNTGENSINEIIQKIIN